MGSVFSSVDVMFYFQQDVVQQQQFEMADFLTQSTNAIPHKYLSYLHNASAIGSTHDNDDHFGQSLQIINPELTIHDLLESLDSQAHNPKVQQCPTDNQLTVDCNSEGKSGGMGSCDKSNNISIQKISRQDYHIRRAWGRQQEEQQCILEIIGENQQLQNMMEDLLNELHEETQVSEHLMQKMITNNSVLAQYKSMHYYYEQQILSINSLIQQHTPMHDPTIHLLNLLSRPNTTEPSNNNMGKQNGNRNINMNINRNRNNKADSTSASVNTNNYTIEYPTLDKLMKTKSNPVDQINSKASIFNELDSELEQQENATSLKNTHHTDQLFKNSMQVSTHTHQHHELTSKSYIYKKIVPNSTWNQDMPNPTKNFIQENKANLRRRLSQKQPHPQHQNEHKKQKIQSKFSTPVKNQAVCVGSWAKLDSQRNRKPIFNQSIKTSQQNSGRAKFSAVKIDVRAIK